MANYGCRWSWAARSTAVALYAAFAGWPIARAEAQTSSITGRPALSASGSTFGPVTRTIDVQASGEALYDSNVARSSDAGAAARGLVKEDMRYRPAIDAYLVVPTGLAVLTLQGVASYDFYQRNDRLNRERINLSGSAASKLAMCDVSIEGGLARNQNDLADLSIVPGDVRASSVNVQTVTRIGATMGCGAPFGLRPTGSVEYRRSTNDAGPRDMSNFDAFSYTGGLGFSSPAVGIVTAFAGHTEFDYPRQPASGSFASIPAFNLTFGGVRLDRRLGARLQFNGQVTYVAVDRDGIVSGSLNGIYWDVALLLRASSRVQLTLATARQIDASSGFTARTAQASSHSADLTFALSSLVRLTVVASHRKRNFDIGQVATPVILLRNDDTDQVTARLTYRAGRRLSFSFGGGYQDRNANVAVYRYRSYRASAGMLLSL